MKNPPAPIAAVVVTGAAQGISYATALKFALNHKEIAIFLPIRAKASEPDRALNLAAKIKQATGHDHVHVREVDLTKLADIEKLAEDIENDFKLQVKALVNVAGECPARTGRRVGRAKCIKWKPSLPPTYSRITF